MIVQASDSIKDTHLKSMLDVVLEQSKKRLELLRAELNKTPQSKSQRERDFMIRECAKLKNIGLLQNRLDEYREKHSKSLVSQKVKEAKATNGADILGSHLRAVGNFKYGQNWHAHHIVCSKHSTHASARFALFAYMGINDPFNGCWLPTKRKYATGTPLPNAVGHSYLHTNKYAEWVTETVTNAVDKQDIIRRLGDIRRRLQDTNNLPDILAENGKADLLKRV